MSIQAGIINLLDELRAGLGLSYLFVAHDLAVVRHIADRVAVMYLGRIVEIGDVDAVFDFPTHPYTQALLVGGPDPRPGARSAAGSRIVLTGDLPSPLERPSRLPVPHPLPEVHRAHRHRTATLRRRGSGAHRRRTGSSLCVPLPGGGQRVLRGSFRRDVAESGADGK